MQKSTRHSKNKRASSSGLRGKQGQRNTATLRIESAKTLSKMDMLYHWFCAAREKEVWPQVVQYASEYLKAQPDGARAAGSVCGTQLGLCEAFIHLKQYKKALSAFANIEAEALDAEQLEAYISLLMLLHACTTADTAPAVLRLYEVIRMEAGDGVKVFRAACFDKASKRSFTASYRRKEEQADNYWRPAYTLFLPLESQCDAGRAATILTTEDTLLIHRELTAVEDWLALPVEALAHAIQKGEPFPIPEKPLTLEEQESLAERMAEGENFAKWFALRLPMPDTDNLQNLSWLRALVAAALRTCTWELPENWDSQRREIAARENMALIRRFAEVETVLLQRIHTPDMLTEENALLLEPMHRWGLYCALAFEALDEGNPNGYLRLLRKGLTVCTSESDMVQFLINRLLEGSKPIASPELLALARKVRAALASCDPDDPAVQRIKESEAYKKTAWLIEPEPLEQMIQ